jgi:hypothetical protein
MTMLIVEYLPYVAFFAAGVLVAWVAADMLRVRRRKPAPAQESVRGLAGPVEPLRALEPEPDIPVSQAVVLPAQEFVPAVEVPEIEIAAATAASEKIVMVKRDPSVRVFDTAVAASERKVVAD